MLKWFMNYIGVAFLSMISKNSYNCPLTKFNVALVVISINFIIFFIFNRISLNLRISSLNHVISQTHDLFFSIFRERWYMISLPSIKSLRYNFMEKPSKFSIIHVEDISPNGSVCIYNAIKNCGQNITVTTLLSTI